MAKSDLSHDLGKNLKKENVHVKFKTDELARLDQERARFGDLSRSAMVRLLVLRAWENGRETQANNL
ncbi:MULTISPECIES: hypothetical protein [Rodentibacter]|uniref:hypothetical protein n=1 Tax=Rodentibacter TaxID=1960084 RepID=UPI001CFE0727|nr:hypothetical protein [Rodentibacter sp. JRC1]GJI55883.1 hypothetical protein HEMROJRC1_09950 [Rodentibacter sp. JRC1]